MENIEEQLTRILPKRGWVKKDVPGEVHFMKTINDFMVMEVVITPYQNNFLNISIYNTTGIEKEYVVQRYSQNFSKRHIQSLVMHLDSVIPMLIEDVAVKFIKSILQKNNGDESNGKEEI